MIVAEMIHDARIIPLNAKHKPAALNPVCRRFDRLVGGRHAGGRDHQHRTRTAAARCS